MCVECAAGGHVSSDTIACDGCGLPHCTDCLSRDEAGVWCGACIESNLRESLEAVGGERLIRAEVELNRQAREQEAA